MKKTLYVVAVNINEAASLADQIGHETRADAERHLREVQAPPTDPAYARQYRIFTVERDEKMTTVEEDFV